MKQKPENKMIASMVNVIDSMDSEATPLRLELLKSLMARKPLSQAERNFLSAANYSAPIKTPGQAATHIRQVAQAHGFTLLYIIKTQKAGDFVQSKYHRNN